MTKQEYDELVRLACWRPAEVLLADAGKSILPADERCTALVSLLGGRRRNEDYGLAFSLPRAGADWLVLVVADGLGGHPGGREASFLACQGVLQAANSGCAEEGPDALLAALRRGAARRVAEVALLHKEGCCLTTALIALITPDRYYLNWLGDGGAWLRRGDGKWLAMMAPQRGPSGLPFEVGGCLGGQQRGFWSLAEGERLAGDFFFLATDGLSEQILDHEGFFRWPLTRIRQDETDMQSAMLAWLESLVTEHPDVFDDNLTLAGVLT